MFWSLRASWVLSVIENLPHLARPAQLLVPTSLTLSARPPPLLTFLAIVSFHYGKHLQD